MFTEILNLIKSHDTIIIHRHYNPDGDAIGSQSGLKNLLIENFPDKKIYAVGDDAGRYSFIEDSSPDIVSDEIYADSLCFVLDSATPSLVSDERYAAAKTTVRFDHHKFVDKFCDVEYVDDSFESCAGLIAYFAKETGLKLNKKSAKALFTGMVTDSGRFRYDSCTARTFLLASYLSEQCFTTSDIYSNLYVDDLKMVRLRATFTLKAKFTEQNVGYIYTDYEEFKTYGVSSFTISRGMVNVMAEIRGVDVWVNFTETEDSVLCELRSSKYDINKIAVKYGGGGHLLASGATLKNKRQAFSMLKDLDKLVKSGNTIDKGANQ